jgi:cytochrome c oxidase assembly factor CtaG
MPALHIGHDLALGAWHLEPTVVGGAVAVFGLYAYGVTTRPEGERLDWLRTFAFAAGAIAIFLALASPLDVAADRLLSMHMLQHVVLTTIGPPLVLLGLPPALLRRVIRTGRLRRAVALVTLPLVTGPLFLLNMWFWHVPDVYEAALTGLTLHITMHLAFLTTGLLFWWPVVQPLPELAPLSGPARLLYLFVTGFPMALLALLLLASGSVLYPYYEQEEPLWGLSPIADQQIAGLIMGVLGEAASFIAFSVLFVRYLGGEEEAAPARTVDAV